MALTVKRATLWTIDAPNTPGTLAATLGPLAEDQVNLDLVMGYTHPDKTSATIEVYPVNSTRARRAAQASGFSKSMFPCVTIAGDNRAGLGRQIASALAEVGINVNFFLAQVIDRKYTGMFSFEADSEADLAVKIIRKALRSSLAQRDADGGRPISTARKQPRKSVARRPRKPTTRETGKQRPNR